VWKKVADEINSTRTHSHCYLTLKSFDCATVSKKNCALKSWGGYVWD